MTEKYEKQIKKKTTPEHFILNNMLNMPKDNKIQLDKDKLAVKSYYKNEVNKNTRFFYDYDEKIRYLVENNYIEEKTLELYSKDGSYMPFLNAMNEMAQSFKFRFNTFMGAFKAQKQYILKSDDGTEYLERIEDRMIFNALEQANGDKELALDLLDLLLNQVYQPATPTYINSGKKRGGERVSCFLINVEDSMNSIGRSINSVLQLSRIGGGVGILMTDVRGDGDPIRGFDNMASGIIPVMKLYEDSLSYSNQLGQRQGAGVVWLNVFHKDIYRFLSTKKENADEKIRMKTLSLGVILPDKFYELKAKDEKMFLFSPYDIEKEYGVKMSDMDITAMYDELVANDNIKKTQIRARELENEISKLQQESGYPYVLNIDTANESNNINGMIKMSNLCSEILQVQTSSEINDKQEFEELGTDISCNLGSMNTNNLMKLKGHNFGKAIATSVRALTNVAINTSIDAVPTIKNGNDKYHSIGLGLMNLHGYFAKNKMFYGSDESIEFTGMLFQLMNYWSLDTSNKIAIEKGETFFEFDKSKYATGEYFDKYSKHIKLKEDLSDKVAELFKDIYIPTTSDWIRLENSIKKHGLYNSYRMAVAPNGSISYLNEATASIHPIIQKIEERQEKKIGKVYYPAPYLSEGALPYYESAYDIDQRKIIDIYAEAQKHVDQALSLTLFMRKETPEGFYEWKVDSKHPTKRTSRDINMLRDYAWSKNIKTIYYVRTFSDDGEDTTKVNECESCTV